MSSLTLGVEGLSWSGAPEKVKNYLFVAQESMKRCILANQNVGVDGKDSLGSSTCKFN